MTPETAARLAALNADFYARFGDDFGATRPRPNPGVQRVLARIPPGATVIDAGCGDAKVGRRLTGGRYLGLDSSAALLDRALELTRAGGRRAARLEAGDLEAWEGRQLDLALAQFDVLGPEAARIPAGRADWVVAFALVHHIPGHDNRLTLLRRLAGWLRPGGRLAVSCWQPQRSPRAGRLIRPWAEAGLDANGLEDRDLLLGWERRGRRGLRYVRVIDPEELAQLAGAAGLRIEDSFSDDGHARDLADYVVCGPA